VTRDLAVLGTGTGVGKTVVTAGLVGRLRAEARDARAVKPVQTGHPPDDDAGVVRATCDAPEAATCLRTFEEPLAPTVAAERAGERIDYDRLRERCRDALAVPEIGVLEGVGGVRVPLATRADGTTAEVIDLVADLGLPAVVVARSGLGTLNHTALTVEALDRRSVPVRGIVLDRYEGATVAERTNPAELERMTGLAVATLPPLDLADPREAVRGVRDASLPRYALSGEG
jgi:dethiobiotin synthetase